MWSRQKLGAAAREIADQLQLIEQVRSLQVAQKDIADAVGKLGDRIHKVEAELQAIRAEVKLEALKEAQQVVYAVQGGLNQQIQELAIKVAVQERLGRTTERALPPPEA